MEKIRVLRVIEYIGDRAAVEDHLKNVLYGEKTFPVYAGKRGTSGPFLGSVTIRAATVGPIPETLHEGAES